MERPVTLINTNKAAELYNARFSEYGRDIKTVGWGNAADQRLRFDVLFRGLDPKGKTILDIGCGLGDLVPYLEEKTRGDFTYIGIDIAEKLVEDAKTRYTHKKITFYTGDIFTVNIPTIDIAVLSGALSFKTENIEQYAYATMNTMFTLCREAACLNFLSTYVDFELEKNQHYQPETVFSKAKMLSKTVNLIHDYPLYEFTIQVIRT
jgi:SAM-dependent methyltransferase